MPSYQILAKYSPAEYTIEAENEEAAIEQMREELHDWADMVELDINCEEAASEGTAGQ